MQKPLTKKVMIPAWIVSSFLLISLAVPVLADTLVLRNGDTIPGALTSANSTSITFRTRGGGVRTYSVRDVQAVEFGDGPSYSGYSGQHSYGNQPPPYGDSRAYGDQQGGPSSDPYGQSGGYQPGGYPSGDYDEARMERVVVPRGTEVAVRTNERIDSRDVVEGQSFSAEIENDIRDADGFVAIPRGSPATLVLRRLEGNGDLTLDVESVTVQDRRYRVSTADREIEGREGVGANERTGKYVGGGALFGAIIGAIAGGGKGAAIGAISGAGAGAAAQTITRGKEVRVPAETVVRFRLDQALRLHMWQ